MYVMILMQWYIRKALYSLRRAIGYNIKLYLNETIILNDENDSVSAFRNNTIAPITSHFFLNKTARSSRSASDAPFVAIFAGIEPKYSPQANA